jgi:hypothetical protein
LLIQRALFALEKSEAELASERALVEELVESLSWWSVNHPNGSRVSVALAAVRAARAKRGTE